MPRKRGRLVSAKIRRISRRIGQKCVSTSQSQANPFSATLILNNSVIAVFDISVTESGVNTNANPPQQQQQQQPQQQQQQQQQTPSTNRSDSSPKDNVEKETLNQLSANQEALNQFSPNHEADQRSSSSPRCGANLISVFSYD